ncbi:hypothetical protein Ais01nite_15780 [Asanoa ishikariensis]|uniref:Uncharacterized protein n=1 Tax=Asanoa ishikariensis TaxID=137265 RepID=A0A1H3UHZ1_9ACTN|nr:hypothetical protein [Asanoa ishikariensis]GIF63543.1 hypothetical protein Ais01nite_15780 [Asanoa ishikariensis]SDZ61681.1 hypothetical protein SAMN05421684_7295 [Asanoa ishikariensis]
MSEPEESYEKTSKTDDILLKPILKDLNHLKDDEDLEQPRRTRKKDAPDDRKR